MVTTASKQAMATSQVMSSSGTRFPKYSELPLELRLQIIEHAIEAYHPPRGQRWSLAQFASIHSDWNKIIERILFKVIRVRNGELLEFTNICGKLHGLLRRIMLNIYPGSLSTEDTVLDCLSELFHIMKGWSGADRKPHDLIKLIISVLHPRDDPMAPNPVRYSLSSFSCDLNSLPVVSVIGEMRIINTRWNDNLVPHHLAMCSLYEKLPNLFSAELEFPCGGSPQEIINDASSNYSSQLHHMCFWKMLTELLKTGSLRCISQSQA